MSYLLIHLWNDFSEKSRKREETRCVMEKLYDKGELTEFHVLTVYDGLFLSLFTDFEEFLEKLFWDLLKGDIDIEEFGEDTRLIAKIDPVEQTESIVLGDKSYLDWLPYQMTEKRAKRFFQSNLPFRNLTSEEKKELEYYHTIRNAIAHKSPRSKKKFHDMIGELNLPPQERTPSGYLRSKPSGQETQYEIADGQLLAIVRKMCRVDSLEHNRE